jgi:MFS family permease
MNRVITFFMFFWQNLSGAAVINYYSPTLFSSIGISDPALYTGIYGLVKAIGSFIFFLFIVDRSGRRIPWLISAAVCAATLFYIAIYLKIAGVQTAGAVVSESTKAGGNAATAMVMIYSLL